MTFFRLRNDRRVLLMMGAILAGTGFVMGAAVKDDLRAWVFLLAAPPSGRGRSLFRVAFIFANALPGAAVWGGIGLAAGAVGAHTTIAIMALAYACIYGLIETQRLAIAVPGLAFQVPASWVRREKGLTVQMLVWGFALGPGILTRNAYASMWLIPAVLALADSPAAGLLGGALAGAAHGLGRSTGVLRNMSFRGPESHLAVLGQYARFRSFDGVLLLVLAGVFAGLLVGRF